MKRIAWTAAGTALLAAAAFRTVLAAPDPGVYLFFTLDTPDLARVIREAREATGGRFRCVLLLDRFPREDWEPAEEFLRAVEEAGRDIPMVDREGLELARRFGVRATPCAVRVAKRVHKASGTRLDWKELLSCD